MSSSSMRAAITEQSEFSEQDDDGNSVRIDLEAQKDRIRKIIAYQKSLYLSSSRSESFSASSSSISSSSQSSSLLELMKVGGMCLGRLFDMEHTTLAAHLNNYSGSPIIRPLFLWESDSCDRSLDLTYWSPVKSFRRSGEDCGSVGLSGRIEEGSLAEGQKRVRNRQRLTRKRSYKALPGFRVWRCKGFRLLFRLRRLKIVIRGKVF